MAVALAAHAAHLHTYIIYVKCMYVRDVRIHTCTHTHAHTHTHTCAYTRLRGGERGGEGVLEGREGEFRAWGSGLR